MFKALAFVYIARRLLFNPCLCFKSVSFWLNLVGFWLNSVGFGLKKKKTVSCLLMSVSFWQYSVSFWLNGFFFLLKEDLEFEKHQNAEKESQVRVWWLRKSWTPKLPITDNNKCRPVKTVKKKRTERPVEQKDSPLVFVELFWIYSCEVFLSGYVPLWLSSSVVCCDKVTVSTLFQEILLDLGRASPQTAASLLTRVRKRTAGFCLN